MEFKGQSLIFEQVMLFLVSVIIFTVSLTVFTIYQDSFISHGAANHLDEVTEWTSSHILKAAEKGTNSTSLAVVQIPRYIAGSLYILELTSGGLTVTDAASGIEKKSTLYYLNETFQFSGKTTSQKGRLTIKKEGNQIIIT